MSLPLKSRIFLLGTLEECIFIGTIAITIYYKKHVIYKGFYKSFNNYFLIVYLL